MSNIRIRRFPSASSKEWELDCFVFPNDETNGEFVHYKLKKALDFRGIVKPGLFAALDKLLDSIPEGTKSPSIKMVLGRLKNEKKTYFYLNALDKYPPESSEAKVWTLIDSFCNERLKERKVI